jgi:hypothetical protein
MISMCASIAEDHEYDPVSGMVSSMLHLIFSEERRFVCSILPAEQFYWTPPWSFTVDADVAKYPGEILGHACSDRLRP